MIAKGRVEWILLVGFLQLVQQQSLCLRLAIDSQLTIKEHDCYTRMLIGSKFREHTFISTTVIPVSDLSKCEEFCTKRGETCKAFTFGVGRKGNVSCTLASEVPAVHDLQTHSDYDVYVREENSGNCMRNQYDFSKRLFHQPEIVWKCTEPHCASIRNTGSPNIEQYKPYAEVTAPDIDSQYYLHSKLNFVNYHQQVDEESWSGDIYSNRFQALSIPAGSTSDSQPGFEEESHEYSFPTELSIFRRYTVTGQACRNGTECQENQPSGFWACELERTNDGTWDYCCAPRQQCGFSPGFQYPWYPMKLHWPSLCRKTCATNANN